LRRAPSETAGRIEQPDQTRKRVIIVSVPFGGGHRAIADGFCHGLRAAATTSADINVIDGFEAISRRLPLHELGAAFYATITRPRLRGLYRLLYVATDRWPRIMGRLCYYIFGGRVRTWLSQAEPDVIVSTFPLVSHVLSAAIADTERAVRLVSVVTDGGKVNRSWFSGRLDAVLVTDDEAFRTAQRHLPTDTSLDRMIVPLRPEFHGCAEVSRRHARALFGLDDRRTVLVWGGGQGLAHGMDALATEVGAQSTTTCFVFVAGGNRRLAARLEQRATGGTRVLGQVEDVSLLLRAVDVVMGKPGWISLNEANALGLHTICFDALPGQELENLRVAVANGSATWEPNLERAAQRAYAAPPPLPPDLGRLAMAVTPVIRTAVLGE
jgi:processive 1,2-diacylglycerol beta-glucosyltransferase